MKNPKFKVGDRVRILESDAKETLGFQRGTVMEVGKRLRRYLVSQRLGYFGYAWWIKEKDLELIKEAE